MAPAAVAGGLSVGAGGGLGVVGLNLVEETLLGALYGMAREGGTYCRC